MPDNRLKITEPKTDSSRRQVMLSQTAIDALRRHRIVQAEERLRLGQVWEDHDLLFPNSIGRPLNPTNLLQRHYYPLLQRAGLPKVRFHDLRHTAATLLLEAGVNVKIVSEMLGHRDVTITMNLYQHVTPTMQKQAADAFDNLLAVNSAVNDIVAGAKLQVSPRPPSEL